MRSTTPALAPLKPQRRKEEIWGKRSNSNPNRTAKPSHDTIKGKKSFLIGSKDLATSKWKWKWKKKETKIVDRKKKQNNNNKKTRHFCFYFFLRDRFDSGVNC